AGSWHRHAEHADPGGVYEFKAALSPEVVLLGEFEFHRKAGLGIEEQTLISFGHRPREDGTREIAVHSGSSKADVTVSAPVGNHKPGIEVAGAEGIARQRLQAVFAGGKGTLRIRQQSRSLGLRQRIRGLQRATLHGGLRSEPGFLLLKKVKKGRVHAV